MTRYYQNLRIKDHDEMACEILGLAKLRLQVGLKWYVEDVQEPTSRGVQFRGFSEETPLGEGNQDHEMASFLFVDATNHPAEKDVSSMSDNELHEFSAIIKASISKQFELVSWGNWFICELEGGLRGLGIKYKINDPLVGMRAVYSLRVTFENKFYCIISMVNFDGFGVLRFGKFLDKAVEKIEFY